MPERQLRLFDPPRPLVDRIGPEFFRLLPAKPGVYLMMDAQNRIIYVGQSKNLRRRLGSYRTAHPEIAPRNVIRLIHAVERIAWEECGSPQLARLRENQLLRAHRPKFNAVNTYPMAYSFVGVRYATTRLELIITRETSVDANLYGAFKGPANAGYRALLRLIWSALYQPISPCDLPRHLLIEKPPRTFQFEFANVPHRLDSGVLFASLEALLSGRSLQLTEFLKQHLPSGDNISEFQRKLFAADIELLQDFYRLGPERNLRACQRNGIEPRLILQEELDDLLVG
ncbi:MAG: hypothetical protein FJ403_12980 [Verrucomicrobia bacterium]|nr:hypothetical protein [Verrucomicrobiota bacterium]